MILSLSSKNTVKYFRVFAILRENDAEMMHCLFIM